MTPASRVPADVGAALASTVANERLRIVAALIGRTGDWDLAEDALQEAITRALTTWPDRGIPYNPGAWLTTAARNAAVDSLRRAATERTTAGKAAVEAIVDLEEERSRAFSLPEGAPATEVIDDDRLRLIFTCCHPALSIETQVALTLRTVVGLGVGEVARAFLVTEPAMQKRLVRARAKIREDGIPYRAPGAQQLPERNAAVLAVVYLMFTEGYSGACDPARAPLADEAIRLARLIASLMTDSPQRAEVLGLLALMLFQHSRAAARTDEVGDLVLLEDQDRALWDAEMIDEGVAALVASEAARENVGDAAGPYRLQAEIALHHATSQSFTATDFTRIAELYARLERVAPTAVVGLHRAIAVALAEGPDAGLDRLAMLEAAPLDGYHLFHATRADLLRRTGRATEALAHYTRALELASTDPERRFLARRIRELRADPG